MTHLSRDRRARRSGWRGTPGPRARRSPTERRGQTRTRADEQVRIGEIRWLERAAVRRRSLALSRRHDQQPYQPRRLPPPPAALLLPVLMPNITERPHGHRSGRRMCVRRAEGRTGRHSLGRAWSASICSCVMAFVRSSGCGGDGRWAEGRSAALPRSSPPRPPPRAS